MNHMTKGGKKKFQVMLIITTKKTNMFFCFVLLWMDIRVYQKGSYEGLIDKFKVLISWFMTTCAYHKKEHFEGQGDKYWLRKCDSRIWKAMENYIWDSLAAGIIRLFFLPHLVLFFFFFVEKKDTSICPCIDFQGLNITIKKKTIPSQRLRLQPSPKDIIFTKLDLRNACHLVQTQEGDEWQMAIKIPQGHIEYLVMPSSLTNGTVIFKALINDVLRNFLNCFVFVYLNNFLIFSQTLDEHKSHFCQVLKVC